MGITEGIGLMEPMLPPDGEHKLEDLAMDLATKASGLASQLPQAVRRSIGDLVRSMNCYYSNLIEGHDTHPRDIDRALAHAASDALVATLVSDAEVVPVVPLDPWDRRVDLIITPTRSIATGAVPR